MRIKRKLPDFQGVAPGGTASLSLPLATTYDVIWLVLTGTAVTVSDVESLEVRANGDTFREYRNGLAGVAFENGFYSRFPYPAASNGFVQQLTETPDFFPSELDAGAVAVPIFFNRPELARVSLADSRLFGFGTLGLDTASIVCKIASGAPADIRIQAYSVNSGAREPGLLTHRKYFPLVLGAGENDVSTIPKNALIAGMTLRKDDADIEAMRLRLDNNDIVEELPAHLIASMQEMHNGRITGILYDGVTELPIAQKWAHLDFLDENDYRQALPGYKFQDMRLKVKVTAAGTGHLDVEYFAPLGGI